MYSVKQLADTLRMEKFDIKNYPVVFETADGDRCKIIDVRRDDEAREVVLVCEDAQIQEKE